MRSTTRSTTARLAVGLAAAVALVGCGDDDDASPATSAEVATTESATTEAADTTEATETTEATDTTEATETTDATTTTARSETTAADTTTSVAATTYTSPEGDFSVVFPGEPTQQTQPQTLPDGSTLDLVLAGYETDTGFAATARGVYPDGYVLDVPVALQGGQDQALANTGGTLLTSQDITLQGRPGREFSASITNGSQTGTQLQRVYLDGLVIYQQIYTGVGEVTFTDPEVATFFESFAFTTG